MNNNMIKTKMKIPNKIWKTKKADMSYVAKIIVMLLGFVAITMIVVFFFTGMQRTASETACHDALVLSLTIAKKFPKGQYYAFSFPKACKTIPIRIESNDKEIVMSQVADLLVSCHETMGQGYYHPFDKNLIDKESVCFLCYSFEVPNLKETITKGELEEFMKKKMPGYDDTYHEYLNYGGSIEKGTLRKFKFEGVKPPSMADLMPRGVYSIVFIGPSGRVFGDVTGNKKYYKPYIDYWTNQRVTGCLPGMVSKKTRNI